MVAGDFTMSDEEEINETAHRKLLAGINSIVRTQDVQKAVRTEPSVKKSEFHLVKRRIGTEDDGELGKPADHTIQVDDLLGILKKTTKHTELGKELKQVNKKRKILSKPLEKPVADRIERDTLYGKAQKKLDLWEPVVTASDVAPQTVFPLQYGSVGIANEAPQKLSQYRVKSDLMKAMEELDRKYKQDDDTDEEEASKYALTLDELRQKRKETAHQKMRELYKIAKGRRMNKIKSKKFHKLMKREKIRSQIKQFEELQKTDPEAALKQLELIEKQRYQERATLRHKNTGSWAKNMQIRAKYDMNVRNELAEQLSIGKELMAKRMIEEESSASGEDEVALEDNDHDGNPWVKAQDIREQEVSQEFTSGYRKYWEQRNSVQKAMRQIHEDSKNSDDGRRIVSNTESSNEESDDSEDERQMEVFKKQVTKSKAISTSSWKEEDVADTKNTSSKARKKPNRKDLNVEELFDEAEDILQQKIARKLEKIRGQVVAKSIDRKQKKSSKIKEDSVKSSKLAFKKKASLADADLELNETAQKATAPLNVPTIITEDTQQAANSKEVSIDPNKFVQMKPKHLLNAIPDLITEGDLSDDDDPLQKHKLTIAEAFEDDDIVADFEREKQDERDRNKPKEVDLFLPGWGSWAGAGINQKKVNKARRKMFKPPPELPRRDDNKEQVIINEESVNKKLAAHLVNELPFPFVSVKDYEASLRAPLGRTFIPETAHSTLVEPRVVTKMGAIIEPLKKDILLQDAKKSFKVGGKLYNKAVRKYEEFLETDVK